MQAYARKRIARTSTIHGLAGMAAIAASTYKAYLGEGLGPLSFIKQLRIPHPGRVCYSAPSPERQSCQLAPVLTAGPSHEALCAED